jgi:hypothetical protein
MKLLSLKVERFRCIRQAKVEFAAGLNVLHGPNDLGKSSLVHAIRAALLLQSNAKEGDAFFNWYETAEPSVELVFESEPQRVWRVKKAFGTATARLEFSKDGVDFSHEARGREVDERLSEILRWGVAPPGGKGRPKGMPETFLTAALLPDQDRVGAIFEQALRDDSDESGKKQLVSALQAMAEDPTFKRVLELVQQRVDEAFNVSDDRVTRKRGKSSPWTKLTEDLNNKQERSLECQRELQKTNAIEEEIQNLHERRLELSEAVTKAEEYRAAVARDLEAIEHRQEIEAHLEEAKSRLHEITVELEVLRQAEARHEEESSSIGALTKKCGQAQAARDVAAKKADQAKEALTRLQQADRVRQRQLEQTTFEAGKAKLEAEQAKLESSLAAIRAIEAAVEKFDVIENGLRDIETSTAKLREKSEEMAATRVELEREDRDLHAVRSFFQWQTARDAVEEAEKGLTQVNEWAAQARDKRAAAAAIEAAHPAVSLPSREQVDTLRRIERDLHLAAAGVNVGVAVMVRLKRPLRVEIRRDGEASTSHELTTAAVDASAQRQLHVDIDGIAEIAVSGGAADARDRMEAIEKRWAAEAAPLLREAGAGSIEELGRMAEDSAKHSLEVQQTIGEAVQLEQRMADQPQWAKLLPERQAALKTAEKALTGEAPSKIEKTARKLRIRDTAEADKRIEALRAQFAKIAEESKQWENQFAAESARLTEKRKSREEARADRDQKQSAMEGDWRELLFQTQKRQADVRNEFKIIEDKLGRLAKAGDDDFATASRAVEAAEAVLAESETALARLQQELNEANLKHASNAGGLKARREAAAKLDESGAREVLAQVEAEVHAAPAPDESASAETLAEADRVVEQASGQLEDIEGEIREKQGALQQVGGEVAKQRAEDATTEFELAKARLSQTELEYEAWDLLRKTMREAEQEEGTNLGRALADPITKRFEALTGGRYGKFGLGPELESEGILVEGEARDVGLLSLGTRDQLSTIFRLTLAEQLNTAVILDDQLAQSDSKRMSWLRGLLDEVARTVQVIVLTCRPADYVDPLPGKSRGKRNDPQPPVHSLDLQRFIVRSRQAAAENTSS